MPTSSQFNILTSIDDGDAFPQKSKADPKDIAELNPQSVRKVSSTGLEGKLFSNVDPNSTSPLTTVHLHVDRTTLPGRSPRRPSPRSALRQDGQHSPKIKRVSFYIPDANSEPREPETTYDPKPEPENSQRRLVELGFRVTDMMPRTDEKENESVSSGEGGQLPVYLRGRRGVRPAKPCNLTSIPTKPETTEIISPLKQEDISPVEKAPPPATMTSLRVKLRGMGPVRIQREPPQPEPLKVCFHCRGSLVSHHELKTIVEDRIHYFRDVKVTHLQFDPLAAWAGDSKALSRWIIALSDSDACHYLKRVGLNVKTQFYSINGYDDILLDEYNVYRMKEEILNDKKMKISKSH